MWGDLEKCIKFKKPLSEISVSFMIKINIIIRSIFTKLKKKMLFGGKLTRTSMGNTNNLPGK